MNTNREECACSAGNKIVIACSGASDVGLISDMVARGLQIAGKRKMNCLAILGAAIQKSVENIKTKELLIIDGCPVACGKRIAEQNSISDYKHIIVTEHNLKKGDSPANYKNVNTILSIASDY